MSNLAPNADTAIRESLDLLPVMVWIAGTDKLCNHFNRAWLDFTGRTLEQEIGHSWAEGVHPDDLERCMTTYSRAFDAREPFAMDYRLRRFDGEHRWIRDAGAPRYDSSGTFTGYIGTCVDIHTAATDRDSARAAAERLERLLGSLRESEERFRQLAGAIQEVFWMIDPRTNDVLYVSPAYETIWGRTCESLLAAPWSWHEAIVPEDRERILQATTGDRYERYDEEYRIRRPDGSIRWIRDRAFPIRDADGVAQRIAGIAHDITERRHLEERLRQAQKMEAVGQLAGGVAHDFNNTLTVIRGNVQLLLEDPSLPSALAEPLRDVGSAADRAATLTQQLLVFSRRRPARRRTLDLNETVAGASRLLARILPENILLETHLGRGPMAVRGDPALLEQIILNLAINARDAMPNGGALVLQTSRAEGAVVLTVADQGVGIPPEHRSRIFEPFFTTKETGQGTGLGLATVHGVVEQHGGSIDVDSEVGRGTTFRVSLPACGDAVDEREGASAPQRETQGRMILVVEDDPRVRSLAQRVLELAGYRVRAACNAAEALDAWREIGQSVALVLTDVVMPGALSGLDLAARLREHRPTLPILFTSGHSDEIVAARTPVREGDDYLPKPYDANALLGIVTRALSRPASA